MAGWRRTWCRGNTSPVEVGTGFFQRRPRVPVILNVHLGERLDPHRRGHCVLRQRGSAERRQAHPRGRGADPRHPRDRVSDHRRQRRRARRGVDLSGYGATRPHRPRRGHRRAAQHPLTPRARYTYSSGAAMRVIVVDDSVIVREGLRRLLEAEGHQVVDAVARPEQVAAAVAATGPDAVILDIRMPPTYTDEGLQIAMSLRKSRPELGILVLSQYAVPEYATQLLESGPRGTGYLLKDRILEPLELTHALQRLAEGGTVVDLDVVGELLAARQTNDPVDRLTTRERDVLQLMAEGLSDKGIAERLYLSPNTIGTHVQHIFRSPPPTAVTTTPTLPTSA